VTATPRAPEHARLFRVRGSSVRGRLVATFALSSTILVLLTGGLLYLLFNDQIARAVDQALRDRAADLSADLHEGKQQVRPGAPFVVVLEPSGRVIESTTISARRSPVLTERQLERAREGEVVVERRRVTGLGSRARLLARPEVMGDGRPVILVVGESLDTVSSVSERLGLLLAATSPLLIGLIVGCGWVLVGAALRPVRHMTEEAEAISLTETGQRLRQPPGDDEIALLGRTLNAMLDRIEASFAHERAFLDDASHELRTPLSILRGELELASGGPRDRDAMAEALTSALHEAEHLSRLTEDLLVLARVDRGGLDARHEAVDLLQAARRSAGRRRDPAGPELEVTGEQVDAAADPMLVDRVLGNLVDNACRHAAGNVRLEVAADGDFARLEVADDGSGFPSAFLAVALDRFTRADGVRRRDDGGSGLGLAIVAALVNGQGGRVRVGNGDPLGGGRVEVWLPLAPPVHASEESVSHHPVDA